jgi:hypothetical protein
MRKTFIKILPFLTVLMTLGAALVPQIGLAQGFLEGSAVSVINTIFSIIANLLLTLGSVAVIVSGTFLSISINLTTHIGDFFNSIPALESLWVVVRNISSMFIIFVLLYASIRTILGVGSTNVKAIIGKVIIAGLLINFSLFFVKLGVDASNIVSLQFYRAIAPGTSENFTTDSVFNDGGLSNVFMSSLKIPQIYQNKKVLDSVDIAASIGIAAIAGWLMMITAAFSFFAAAIAFTIRTGLLLFIMALSPIFFAGMIFPQIKAEVSDKLLKLLKGQLVFMPAYLFLMYIALRFISSDGFNALFNANATGVPGAGESVFGPTWIGIIVQYVIALVFINAPLLFAIQLGAVGAKWAPDVKSVTGFFGQHTLGRGAKRVSAWAQNNEFINRNPNMAVLLNKGLGKASSASYLGSKGGYDKRFKDYSKEIVDYGKKLKTPQSTVDSYVSSGMNKWHIDQSIELANIRKEKDKYKAIMVSGDASITEDMRNVASNKLRELEEKESRIKNNLTNEEARKKIKENLEKEAKKIRTNDFAKSVESGKNPITSKANKDAADALRKEINKKSDEKALDILESILKKEGGDKDKDK